MKKILMLCAFMMGISGAFAQETGEKFYGVVNHIGADLNVGSQGIGIDLAVPITQYAELSIGLNTMPAIRFDKDVKVGHIKGTAHYTEWGQSVAYPYDIDAKEVNIKANLERTTGEVKLSLYPFGAKNAFFVTGGLSFGGHKIAKITGHSDEIVNWMNDPTIPDAVKDQIYGEVDKYDFHFDRNGNARGDIRVRKHRPYVGLGYGRLVPKKSIGFRVEAGVQFMGEMKLYQDGKEIKIADQNLPADFDDAISDILESVKIYPVLKFSITTRLL